MHRQKESLLFKIMIWVIRRVYHAPVLTGAEHLGEEPCIVVGNHAKTHGPIVSQLYFPENSYTWCASQVMHLSEFPPYAFDDFWSHKPRWSHWFWHLLSCLIAPFGVSLMTNARTIETCYDSRILTTFRTSVKKLQEGNHIIIFPECRETYSHIVNQFHDGFVNVARLYYRKTGRAVQFVPMYLAPGLHQTVLGRPVRFQPDNPPEEERQRICRCLMEEITEMASSLPPHRVIPYDNKIPKRSYPWNTYEGVGKNG